MTCALILLALAILACASPPAIAKDEIEPWQRAVFEQAKSCPSGGFGGVCPGYEVRRVVPECRGGAATPSNLEWVTPSEAWSRKKLGCIGFGGH